MLINGGEVECIYRHIFFAILGDCYDSKFIKKFENLLTQDLSLNFTVSIINKLKLSLEDSQNE